MRILCVTSSYPRHARDASGRFVYELTRGLLAAGARDDDRVHVLTFDDALCDALSRPGPQSAGPLTRSFRSGQALSVDRGSLVRVAPVRYAWPRRAQRLFHGSGAPENLARAPWLWAQAPAAAAALAAAVARHARDADVVLAHWLVPAGLAAVVGAAAAGKRVVVVAHSGDVHALARLPLGVGGALARFVARRAGVVCAVADDVRERLRALGVEAQVLPLGAELPRPTARRELLRVRFGVGARDALVATLGRLERVKGYDVLVDALAGRTGTTLVFAGDGSERAALVRRARERGVDLRAIGFADEQRKADLLHAADVVVFPSRRLGDGRSEGLPVALLEARAAGCTIVASDVGGVREALRSGDRLVPPGDAAALRAALDGALARPTATATATATATPTATATADPYSLTAAAHRYRAALAAAAVHP